MRQIYFYIFIGNSFVKHKIINPVLRNFISIVMCFQYASFVLAIRFRLIPDSAASITRWQCISGETQTMNFPLNLHVNTGCRISRLCRAISFEAFFNNRMDAFQSFFGSRGKPTEAKKPSFILRTFIFSVFIIVKNSI